MASDMQDFSEAVSESIEHSTAVSPTNESSVSAQQAETLDTTRDDSERIILTDLSNGHVSETPPSHDFAFYEWDFQDTDDDANPTGDLPAVVPQTFTDTACVREEHPTPPPRKQSSIRNTIEDLMQPSMYKSQLSKELGASLAAELHSDMFGGVPAESQFASRDRTHSTGVTDPSIQGGESPAAASALPPPMPTPSLRDTRFRQSRTISHAPQGTAELVERTRPPAFSDADVSTRSHRRSRTADFQQFQYCYSDGETSNRSRQRSLDEPGSLKKLLSKLSLKKKK